MGEEIEVGPRMRAAGATMSLVAEVLLLTGGVRSPGAHARFVKWLTDDSGQRGCVSAISPESRGLRRSKGLSLTRVEGHTYAQLLRRSSCRRGDHAARPLEGASGCRLCPWRM
jgi:hypothetical protein